MTTVLAVDRISKRIGSRTIVSDLTFEVKKGEIFGLLGPNGAGKTTTIRMLVGLAKPTEGRISVGGHDIERSRREAMKRIGTIVENPELYPYLTGYANLRQFARLHGPVDDAKIRDVVQLVGLKERIDDKVRRYSLGMRQRLGVAQALLHDPALLILDEPTNGLDPSGIREFRQLLLKLADRGKSVLISSHLLAEIEQVCDRIGVIDKGRWVTTASMDDIRGRSNDSRLVLRVDNPEAALALLDAAFGAAGIHADESGRVVIERPGDVLNPVLRLLIDSGIQIKRAEQTKASLEDVFLTMTGGTANHG